MSAKTQSQKNWVSASTMYYALFPLKSFNFQLMLTMWKKEILESRRDQVDGKTTLRLLLLIFTFYLLLIDDNHYSTEFITVIYLVDKK